MTIENSLWFLLSITIEGNLVKLVTNLVKKKVRLHIKRLLVFSDFEQNWLFLK